MSDTIDLTINENEADINQTVLALIATHDSDFVSLVGDFERALSFDGFSPKVFLFELKKAYRLKGREAMFINDMNVLCWLMIHRGSKISNILKRTSEEGLTMLRPIQQVINIVDSGRRLEKKSVTLPRVTSVFPHYTLRLVSIGGGDLSRKICKDKKLPEWTSSPSFCSLLFCKEGEDIGYGFAMIGALLFSYHLSYFIENQKRKNTAYIHVQYIDHLTKTSNILDSCMNSDYLDDTSKMRVLIKSGVINHLKVVDRPELGPEEVFGVESPTSFKFRGLRSLRDRVSEVEDAACREFLSRKLNECKRTAVSSAFYDEYLSHNNLGVGLWSWWGETRIHDDTGNVSEEATEDDIIINNDSADVIVDSINDETIMIPTTPQDRATPRPPSRSDAGSSVDMSISRKRETISGVRNTSITPRKMVEDSSINKRRIKTNRVKENSLSVEKDLSSIMTPLVRSSGAN